MPKSIDAAFQGATQAFQASLTSEPLLILAALVTVYIILGVLYESFIHPITILSTLPSAGLGALLALMLFHNDLNVIALIGIILLIGIVQKNAIMMVDFALSAEREQGLTPEDAIYQACLFRFRPILMTTLAAMFGGLPLALGIRHRQLELRRPLGIAIVGGLDRQPAAHALYHAGHLSRLQPCRPVVEPRQSQGADVDQPRARHSLTSRTDDRPRTTTAPRSEAGA